MPFPFLALAALGAAANGGLSILGANARNAQIEQSMRSNNAAAAMEIQQQHRIAALQRERSRRAANRTFGLITVSAAERGVGMGGSVAAIERTAAVDEALNQNAMDIEAFGAGQRTLASLRNTQTSLASQGQSLALAGLTGAIQGAQTGLSIGQGIQGLSASPDLPPLYDMGPPKYLQ